MVVVSITLPARLLKRFDEFTKRRGYFSRSEAFRDAVRSLISEKPVVEMGTERLFATIMVVSEYARKNVLIKLTRISCELDDIILESLHRKIADRHCLTVFVAEGSAQRMQALTKRIRGIRGIEQVKTVFMP